MGIPVLQVVQGEVDDALGDDGPRVQLKVLH